MLDHRDAGRGLEEGVLVVGRQQVLLEEVDAEGPVDRLLRALGVAGVDVLEAQLHEPLVDDQLGARTGVQHRRVLVAGGADVGEALQGVPVLLAVVMAGQAHALDQRLGGVGFQPRLQRPAFLQVREVVGHRRRQGGIHQAAFRGLRALNRRRARVRVAITAPPRSPRDWATARRRASRPWDRPAWRRRPRGPGRSAGARP